MYGLLDLSVYGPLLALAGFALAVGPFLDRGRDRSRMLVVALALGLSLHYLAWRLFDTVLPFDGTRAEEIWIWFVFAIELAGFVEVFVFFLTMAKAPAPPGEADRRQRDLALRREWPSVDVFIPTYNEPLEVLEKTILGARALDYPDFQVWVLDDGRRDWLREFCARKRVGYLARPDNAHAKAGNLNAALPKTSGELIAIFDADFVPHRNFLRRTVGYFGDPELGILQTPQEFYSTDPVQHNLHIAREWSTEQAIFFRSMAASRDAWGVSFCCGSCSITRRAALYEIGGFPTASITEDLLTTLALKRVGYKTRYLNERLSQGLAPETLEAFFVQRARWCQGGIQTLFLKEGPLGPGLTLLERLLFFPTSWVVQYLVRFFALMVPIVFFFTGLQPLKFATFGDLIFYLAPVLVAHTATMVWLVGRQYMPLLNTAVGIFATFRLLPTVVSSLVQPFGRPFRVTPKGNLNKAGVDWGTLSGIAAVAGLTALGLFLNAFPGWQVLSAREFFPVAVAWAFLNLLLLTLAALICFDAPRHRKEERFLIGRMAALAIPGGESPAAATVRVSDMSLSGAKIEGVQLLDGKRVELQIAGIESRLPARVVATRDGCVALRFEALTEEAHDQLVAYLFSGDFTTEPDRSGTTARLWRHVWQRFVGEAAA